VIAETLKEITRKVDGASLDISTGEHLAETLSGMVTDERTWQLSVHILDVGQFILFYDKTGITDRLLTIRRSISF